MKQSKSSTKVRFESEQGTDNGQPCGTWTATLDGKAVAWIEKETDDVSSWRSTSRVAEWKVTGYDVSFASEGNGDRFFASSDYPSARAALAAAKAYVRENA